MRPLPPAPPAPPPPPPAPPPPPPEVGVIVGVTGAVGVVGGEVGRVGVMVGSVVGLCVGDVVGLRDRVGVGSGSWLSSSVWLSEGESDSEIDGETGELGLSLLLRFAMNRPTTSASTTIAAT